MDSNQNQILLSRLELISAAQNFNLKFNELLIVQPDLDEISRFMGINDTQSVLLACITELSFQRNVTLENIARHFKCSVLRLITHMHELEALEKKGYIEKNVRNRGRKYSYNDIGYSIPHNVIEALRTGESSRLIRESKFDLPGFLKQVVDIIEERRSDFITTHQLVSEIEALISVNQDLPYVSFIDKSLSLIISKCTVFALSYTRLKGQHLTNIESFAEAIFDDLGKQLEYTQQIVSANHELITNNLLDFSRSEFDGDKTVNLSEKTAKMLYQAYPALLVTDLKNSGLISYKSLINKKLFFNDDVHQQVNAIEEILKPSKFRIYKKALEENKLAGGITVIFFGPPGTGKTEVVYQIARKTGRDIMMVDLSQTKSKWFGESEKQVKKIFDDYALLLKNSEREPILFINEADGLFTKRMGINSNGSSADISINTMQNILLQALENFNGILLATTNLTDNMDKAFERRFSFKINFKKPDKNARKRIWKK